MCICIFLSLLQQTSQRAYFCVKNSGCCVVISLSAFFVHFHLIVFIIKVGAFLVSGRHAKVLVQ